MAKIAKSLGSAKAGKFRTYRRYEFDKLKKQGDYFVVADPAAFNSLRAQASKRGRAEKRHYSATLTERGIVVQYMGPRTT